MDVVEFERGLVAYQAAEVLEDFGLTPERE